MPKPNNEPAAGGTRLCQQPPLWMRQMDILPARCLGAASGPLCDGYALAQTVYGPALGANSGLTAFAYCWRRFGPPWWGSDAHKDLVGYILGTSHPEVFLSLRLSASPLLYGVGYLVTQTLQRMCDAPYAAWEAQFASWWLAQKASAEDHRVLAQAQACSDTAARATALSSVRAHLWEARLSREVMDEAQTRLGRHPGRDPAAGRSLVEHAMQDALRELLRPMFIRDVAITILGRLRDDDLDETQEQAACSPYAGYGVPKEAMDAQVQPDEVVGAPCLTPAPTSPWEVPT